MNRTLAILYTQGKGKVAYSQFSFGQSDTKERPVQYVLKQIAGSAAVVCQIGSVYRFNTIFSVAFGVESVVLFSILGHMSSNPAAHHGFYAGLRIDYRKVRNRVVQLPVTQLLQRDPHLFWHVLTAASRLDVDRHIFNHP